MVFDAGGLTIGSAARAFPAAGLADPIKTLKNSRFAPPDRFAGNGAQRFAAEMHDGLGQSLVIIKNRARLSLKADQKEAMLDHLARFATVLHAIHEAKEIAFNLRPHLLDVSV